MSESVNEESIFGIYKAVVAVMSEIGAIGKSNRNQAQGYNFRGIDDVYNALQPALIKCGVFIAPTILEKEFCEISTVGGKKAQKTILTVRFKFYTTDGSFVEADAVGEAYDMADKATNKAMSAAFKYAAFQVFCIPTKEMMIDTENDHIEADRAAGQTIQGQGQAKPAAGQGQKANTGQPAGQGQKQGQAAGNAKVKDIADGQKNAIKNLCESTGADPAEQASLASQGRVNEVDQLNFDEAVTCIGNLKAL